LLQRRILDRRESEEEEAREKEGRTNGEAEIGGRVGARWMEDDGGWRLEGLIVTSF
jgi:hypothetical protein